MFTAVEQYLTTKSWIKSFSAEREALTFARPWSSAVSPVAKTAYKPQSAEELLQSYTRFCEKAENIASTFGVRASPLDIVSCLQGQIFTGSGVEYLFPYKYSAAAVPRLPAYLLQPSIRLHAKLSDPQACTEMLENNFSLAFVNFSAVQEYQNPNDMYSVLEKAIDFLSALGIHCCRITLVMEEKYHEIELDGNSIAIKIFVDQVEVGDIVIIFSLRGRKHFIEFGLGIERLFSRRHNTNFFKSYCGFLSPSDPKIALFFHFLTLVCMSYVPRGNDDAWSKARQIARHLSKNWGQYDSFYMFDTAYTYWKRFTKESLPKLQAYYTLIHMIKKGD